MTVTLVSRTIRGTKGDLHRLGRDSAGLSQEAALVGTESVSLSTGADDLCIQCHVVDVSSDTPKIICQKCAKPRPGSTLYTYNSHF